MDRDVEAGIIITGQQPQPENVAETPQILQPNNNLCPVCMDPYHNLKNDTTRVNEESSPLPKQVTSIIHPKQAIQIEGCGHTCCRECLTDYCNYHISVRQVPVPCPILLPGQSRSFQPCPEYLSPKQVQELFSSTGCQEQHSSSWIQFQRLHLLSKNPTFVSCTRCDEIVPPTSRSSNEESTTTTRNESNDRTCPACQHEFCALHGDAHIGRSCQDHAAPTTTSHEQLGDDTKACSHCTTPLQKFAGCDHVICPACQKDMCFRCGTHAHLSGQSMTRYCSNCRQGYLDHRYLWRIRFMYLTWFVLALPVVCVYVVIAIVVTILSACCGGCFLCGTATADENGHCNLARGALYVGLIIILPISILLYDAGYQWSWLVEFIDWLENTDPPPQPTATSSSSSLTLDAEV